MTDDDIMAVGRIVKDCRKALEPALKPLEGEIRGELGMGEMAKLGTMLLTYNMDKSLGTPDAARNYITMQNIMMAAAQRAVKLPDMASTLPPEAQDPRVAAVLGELGANALLSVLQKPAAGFTMSKPVSFED